MMKLIISLFMIFFSSIMFFINHPLAMGLLILLQTMLLSLFIGLFTSTYWFSYILFLIFLGGLLVLFIYISSIASNELIIFSLKMKLSILSMMFLIFMFSIFNYKNLNLLNLFNNNVMEKFFHSFLFFQETKINLSKLYNNQTFFITMMLIIYLFITLIAVIKITNIFFGPLRSFN
uniref:NADH dehydrogenase subunit 6 n=1 Tax=Ixias pyrene TaxID=320243 RepID=UPI00237B83CD|nr:NADH dehydrogenase subunit 6 [Ixias pyrene]WBV74672.1 NADH dehydrogenase subunit 6 [Ixias pyrene]